MSTPQGLQTMQDLSQCWGLLVNLLLKTARTQVYTGTMNYVHTPALPINPKRTYIDRYLFLIKYEEIHNPRLFCTGGIPANFKNVAVCQNPQLQWEFSAQLNRVKYDF